jgi:hypothetical protein
LRADGDEGAPDDDGGRARNEDIGSTRDVGMSKRMTLGEGNDEEMAVSDGECGPKGLGDTESEGRVERSELFERLRSPDSQ